MKYLKIEDDEGVRFLKREEIRFAMRDQINRNMINLYMEDTPIVRMSCEDLETFEEAVQSLREFDVEIIF